MYSRTPPTTIVYGTAHKSSDVTVQNSAQLITYNSFLSPGKQFVANIMFNYYDRNNNQALDEAELQDVEHRDHLEKLSRFCGLADMLTYDDKQEDGNISLPEFYNAFGECLTFSMGVREVIITLNR